MGRLVGLPGRKERRKKRGEARFGPPPYFSSFFVFLFPTGISEKRKNKENKIRAILFYQNNYLPLVYLFDKTKVGLVLLLVKIIWFQRMNTSDDDMK